MMHVCYPWLLVILSAFFFFNDTATTEIYTLPLHDALPICLGHTHHVVIGHDLLRAVVGESQHRTPVLHQRDGAAGERRKGIGADIQGVEEAGTAGQVVGTAELVSSGEGDGMHQDVDHTQGGGGALEQGFDLPIVGDVAGFDERRADGFGQRTDAPLQALHGVGEGHPGAVLVHRLGDAPGDRVVVGYSEDQRGLAFQETGHAFSSSSSGTYPGDRRKRQGLLFHGSGTFSSPTRGPRTTARRGGGRGPSLNRRACGEHRSWPLNARSTSIAWHSLAGPSVSPERRVSPEFFAANPRSRRARRRRIVATPSDGARARNSTAAGRPFASVTTFRHQ